MIAEAEPLEGIPSQRLGTR